MPYIKGETSKDIREYLMTDKFYRKLQKERGCDWFIIGGRWSGKLGFEFIERTKKFKEFYNECEKKELFYSKNKKEESMKKAKKFKIFKKYFPNSSYTVKTFPWNRNGYEEYGYEDDGQIVDEKIWKMIKRYAYGGEEVLMCYPKNEPFTTREKLGKALLNDKSKLNVKKENTIGKKWVVVVDYHT